MKLVLAMLVGLTFAHPVFADPVDDLTKQLASSNEKSRLSATITLARMGDKRALKPLVQALHDPSAEVRAIAAAGLGKLKHKASLPALKAAATDDTDETVRKKAREAAIAVAKENGIADELPADPVAAATTTTKARRHSGFGRSPHAVAD
ncbi:MAG TPA: HEAT repeat domain-containing protein, partial [Kofleriaceae bacterium]